MSIISSASGLNFSADGKSYEGNGVLMTVAVIVGPLAELGGSGQGTNHPEYKLTAAFKKMISETYAESRFPKDSDANVIYLPHGSIVNQGDVVAWKPSMLFNDGKEALLIWDEVCPGLVTCEAADITVSPITGNVRVAMELLGLATSGGCEKFRGTAGKLTGDGGYNRNVRVVSHDGDVIFDPATPLYHEDGDLAQVEMIYGPEESKTLNVVLEMIGQDRPGGVVFNSDTGHYENEDEIMRLVEERRAKVDMTVWGVNPRIYAMWKTLYGARPEFEFNDDERRVTHHGADAYIGQVCMIVEVPVTSSFAGKAGLYFEQHEALRVVIPEVAAELDKGCRRNQKLVEDVLKAVSSSTDGIAWVTSDTIVVKSDYAAIETVPGDFGVHVSRIIVPGYVDHAFFGAIQGAVEGMGLKGVGFIAEGYAEDFMVQLNLRVFAALQGANSTVGYRKLTSILDLLSLEEDGSRQNSRDKDYIRAVAALRSVMENLISDSSALFARAASSADVCVSMRARASVFLDEGIFVISPRTAEYYGIEDGFLGVAMRIPMAGFGGGEFRIDPLAPDWVIIADPAFMHEYQEGDVDGDQMLCLVINNEGDLHLPPRKVRRVSAVAD